MNRGSTDETQIVEVKTSDFVICTYDDLFWIGLIDVIDTAQHEAKFKFMHPNYPANSFHWPRREDSCYVPLNNILCVIEAPYTATGCQYHLKSTAVKFIEEQFKKKSVQSSAS